MKRRGDSEVLYWGKRNTNHSHGSGSESEILSLLHRLGMV